MHNKQINPITALQALVDTTEKLYVMPHDEILKNGQLVDEMRNALNAHNIDAIVNAARNAMTEFTGQTTARVHNQTELLRAFARREHEKLKNVVGEVYHTKIIDASAKNAPHGEIPAKAGRKAEKEFAAVYNSIYANGAMKINTPQDPSTLMSYIDYSPYRVNFTEYLSVPTLSEMVDRPIAMAMKKFPKIHANNPKFEEMILRVFKETRAVNVIKDALFFSVLSPRGSLVVPIQRGKGITFNVFNDTQFAYGMGSSYSGVTAPYMPTRVGDLYCMGAKLRHGVSAFFTCPGYEPLFGVGLNRVPQLRAAAEAWNLYVHVLKILLVRAQVIIERMDGDIQTDTMVSQMRAQLARLSQSMGVSTPVAQARGATLDIMNNNISPGTSEIAGVFRDFVASVTGLAPEYFFGGGNAAYSQAAFQIAVTNENIRARYQIGMIEPLVRFMIDTLIRNHAEIMGLGVGEGDYEIEFESIYDETEQEKADLNAKKTEVLIRQCEYPELEDAFKKLGILDDDVTLPKTMLRTNDGSDGAPGAGGEIPDDGADSTLTKPMK